MIALPRVAYMLLNILIYQVGWLACILSAAKGLPYAGVAVAGALLATHLLLTPAPRRDLALAGALAIMGLVVDSILALSGWMVFREPGPLAVLTPPWLLAVWALFAVTLHASLGWLKGRYVLSAFLGGPAGALAYWAGQRLGAVSFPHSLPETLAVLALVWGAVLPAAVWIAGKAGTDPDEVGAPTRTTGVTP